MKNTINNFFDLNSIKDTWNSFFNLEIKKPYFLKMEKYLKEEYQKNICFPLRKDIFYPFNILNPCDIKVVILGQDPYYNKDQACGLAFSIKKNSNVKTPLSLKNIFKELENDLGIKRNNSDLSDWLKQGVFLYNCILTVRLKQPTSHKGCGWLEFSDNLIKYLNKVSYNIIYLLLGNYSKSYSFKIKSFYIIKLAHPSPLSVKKFWNTKPFSKINNILKLNNKKQIKW